MKKILILIVLLLFILTPFVVHASDISNARWVGGIDVTNNSTLAENVATTLAINPDTLIDNFGLSENFSETAIQNSTGADVRFMPSSDNTNPWLLWVPSISDYVTQRLSLYIGNVTDGTLRYFPALTGLSITDAADIELSDNFTLEFKGYVDTANGSSKYLYYKENAAEVYVSDTTSGNITAEIFGDSNWANPTGFNDPDTKWDNEANAYNDNTGDYARQQNVLATSWGNFIELTISSVNSTQVRYYAGGSAGPAITQIDVDVYDGASWTDVYQGNFSYTTWETKTFTRQEITKARFKFYNSQGTNKDAYLYEVDIGSVDAIVVSATGVSSGEHTVEITTSNSTTNFGNDSIEVLESTIVDEIRATKFTTTEGSFCQSIVAYIYSASGLGDRKVKGAIYDSSFNLLGETGEEDLPTDGTTSWRTLSFASAIELSQDTIYWLAVWGGASNSEHLKAYYADGETNQTAADSISYDGYPDPLIPDGNSNYVWSVYAEVIPGFAIVIDGSEKDRILLAGASVHDNSNNITLFENGSMPYVEEFSQYEGDSNRILQYDFNQYLDSTTIPDQVGSNNGTATFRTTGTDPDVIAILASLQPISQATSNATPTESWPEMVSSVPTQPTTTYTDTDRPGFFFEPLIHSLLAAGSIPDEFFWTNFCFAIIIIAGMISYRIMPSLVLKAIVMVAFMAYFAGPGLNVFGAYVILYFILYCFGLIIASRSHGL